MINARIIDNASAINAANDKGRTMIESTSVICLRGTAIISTLASLTSENEANNLPRANAEYT